MRADTETGRDSYPPEMPGDDRHGEAGHDASPSLVDDVEALYNNGKSYVEAELRYQKTRGKFAAGRVKNLAVYGVAAAALAHLALIALVIGLMWALTPLVGPWWSVVIVVGVLALLAYLAVRKLQTTVKDISAVFEKDAR